MNDVKMNERKKIFLVDDVTFTLERTKQFLKDYYEVYSMKSAEKMFDLLKVVKPDLILLDINMPDMDGYEAIKVLKADNRFSDIPVIFLSAKYDEDSIIMGLGLGAADHVSKPYEPQTLVERIEKQLAPDKQHDVLHGDEDGDFNKQCILAVDDSPSMLRSIHFALSGRYKVYTLPKPEKLRDVLENIKPDLFLLDYNMPLLNGLELVYMIREYPEHKKTPVIFLTSDSSPNVLNEAINIGVNDYIVKPFNPRKLRDKVSKYIYPKRDI